MKISTKELDIVINELREAMKEMLELDEMDTNIKLKKQKAQKRLLMAKEEVRDLQVTF